MTGGQIDCILGPGDQDWFRLTFTTPGVANVPLYLNGLPANVDAQLELWDATGTTLLAFSDDCRGVLPGLSLNLPAGTYLARVLGATAATTGGYSLDTAVNPADPYGAFEVEPNDTVATANPIAVNTSIRTVISTPTDVDTFQVVLPAPRTGLYIQVLDGDAPCISRTRVDCLTAAGMAVPIATHGLPFIVSSDRNFRIGQFRVFPGGTYNLAVKASSSTGAGTVVPTGSLRFDVTEMPMNVNGVVAEGPEPNASTATATPIGFGQQGSGNLTPGDSDWWRIDLPGPSYLTIQTANGPAPSLTDTSLTLYDAAGLPFGFTATLGNTLEPAGTSHARFHIEIPAALRLFVEVSGGTPTSSGNYQFEIGGAPMRRVPAFAGLIPANAGGPGTPTTLDPWGSGEVPVLGTTFSRQVTTGALRPILYLRGFSNQFANGNVPLPYNLAPHGAPGCTLDVDPLAVNLYVADAAGSLILDDGLPSNPAFNGIQVYEQAVALETSPFALRPSRSFRLNTRLRF